MNKKKTLIIALIAVVLIVIFSLCFLLFVKSNNDIEKPFADNLNYVDETENNADIQQTNLFDNFNRRTNSNFTNSTTSNIDDIELENATNGNTSDTEDPNAKNVSDTLSNESNLDIDNGINEFVLPSGPVDENGQRIDYEQIDPQLANEADKISLYNQDQLKVIAVNAVEAIRNYSTASVNDMGEFGWNNRIEQSIDVPMARRYTESNLIIRQLEPVNLYNYANNDGVLNQIEQINVNGVYMNTIDMMTFPVAYITTTEIKNRDYPLANSDHWKPVDRVNRSYDVYLTPDGTKVFVIKLIEETILEKNIYNMYDPDMYSHQDQADGTH